MQYELDEQENLIVPPPQPEYASLNRRIIAFTIDSFIITFITILLEKAMRLLIPPLATNKPDYEQLMSTALTGNLTNEAALGMITNTSAVQDFLITQVISILIFFAYFFVLWRLIGNTPGKMLLHCEIVDADTLQKPSRRQFHLRLFGYLMTSSTLGLGFISAMFNRRSQTVHDYIAKTVVIRKHVSS